MNFYTKDHYLTAMSSTRSTGDYFLEEKKVTRNNKMIKNVIVTKNLKAPKFSLVPKNLLILQNVQIPEETYNHLKEAKTYLYPEGSLWSDYSNELMKA